MCRQRLTILGLVLLTAVPDGFAAPNGTGKSDEMNNRARSRTPVATVFSLNRSLSKVRATNADGSRSVNPALFQWTYGLTLIAGGFTGWSGEFGLTGYADTQQKSPGSSDFSYVLAFRPKSLRRLKFGYDNYGSNQFRPDRGRGEQVTTPSEGVWSATFTLNDSARTAPWLKLHHTSRLGCSAGPRYQQRYEDSAGMPRNDRFFFRFSCQYVFYRHLFLTVDTNFFQAQRQFASDADFTWEFGWNSYANRSFALLYRNYAAHRFPWRSGKRSPRWRDGSLALQWRLVW